MSLDHLFKAQFTTGQTIKIVTPKGAMLDACEVNIGNITGKARSIPAILCDGVTSDDPWHIVNVIDSTKVLLDHIAVKGAVSLSQAERLCHKYLPVMVKGQVRNVVSMTDNAMKTFLDSTSLPSNTPFVLDSDAMLLDSMTTVQTVQWDENNKLLSHGGHISGVMYDMACCDTQGDLLTRVSPRDIAAILIDETCEFGGMLDAMITQYNKFDNVMLKVAEALKIYDNEDLFVKSVTPIEPFKRNGVVNIGTIFEMSDTQTITVLFNNPDTTPSKLLGTDVLTSWKWMLNKRDVTATLQPRAVESKKYPVIAGRIIKLLAKNHDRFKRAQAVRQKEELFLNELVDQVEAEQSGLRYLDKEILRLQQIIDNETVRKQNQTEVGKADPVDLSAEGAEQFHNDLKESLEQNEQSVQMNNEQAIKQKATDLKEILISNHDFTTDTLAKQGEHTHNLLTKNGAHLAIFTFIDETANGIWTLGLSSGGEINRLADIDTRADTNEIAQKLVEFDDKVTVLTGNELGDFDLPEETEKLRSVVGELLTEMKKTPIFCPALNTNVNIGSNVIKKTLGFSADTRKLKALAHLKELLQNADKIQELPNRKQGKSENVKAFHILSSSLNLDGESLEVRYVIREDNNGHYHYDNSVNKTISKNAKSPLLDGLSATVFPMPCATHEDHALQIRIANCQRTGSIENNQMNVNAMLDSAKDDGEVLNMFIVEQDVQLNNDGDLDTDKIPGAKKNNGVVFQKEAESIWRSIDYSVTDYQGHTKEEFKRADVKGRLEGLVLQAQALLERRFRVEHQRKMTELSIKSALETIERWESVQTEPEITPEVAPEPTSEYRYALIRRPVGVGNTPSEGFIRSEAANDNIAAYARHGVAVYDRLLSEDEMQQYEIKYIPSEEEVKDAVVQVATKLSTHKFADKYLNKINLGNASSLELMIAKTQKDLFPNVLFTRPQQFLFDVSNAFVMIMNTPEIEVNENVPEVNENVPEVNETEQFLNNVIDGHADMSDPSFSEKLLELAEDLDPSLEELFEKASDVYADYAIALEV